MQGKTGADEGEGMEADAAAGGVDSGGGGSTNAVALELLPFPQINVVDFGSIHINERAARKVRIGLLPPIFMLAFNTPPLLRYFVRVFHKLANVLIVKLLLF